MKDCKPGAAVWGVIKESDVKFYAFTSECYVSGKGSGRDEEAIISGEVGLAGQ